MKVLQIGLGNASGGVEAFVMNYYRELVKLDVQFDFVCMYDKIAFEEEIESLGGCVFYIPNVKKNYFGYISGLKKVLSREHYDAVHVNMLSAANIVPLKIAKKLGISKVIAHSHNSSCPGVVRQFMDKINRPKIQKYATDLLACGDDAARWLFGQEVYTSGKVIVVRNAVSAEKYFFSEKKRQQIRNKYGWDDRFIIGHVGRFELQKNHEAVIEIFKQVHKRVPDALLCLVGDGILQGRIKEKVAQAQLQNNVFFAGSQKNVNEFLSAMDVFLFPSLFEGVPFAMIEAQVSGLPCIMSDTISREAVILSRQVKILSLDTDYETWADGVCSFLGAERVDMSSIKEGLEKRHFDIKKEAERLKRLYQERVKNE